MLGDDEPLVGVDPLVGDGGYLAGVVDDPGDELPGDLREVVLVGVVVEGVGVAVEKRHVGVHPRALHAAQSGLGMKVARNPFRAAISFTTTLTSMTVSAIVMASV